MDVGEIDDEKSFEAWLKKLPRVTQAERDESQRWAVVVAHRAAMRVLPVIWNWTLDTNARELGLTVLPVLSANVIAGAAGIYPTPPIQRAARSAAAVATAVAAVPAVHSGNAVAARSAASAAARAVDAAAARSAEAANIAARSIAEVAAAVTLSAPSYAADSAARKALQTDCAALVARRDPHQLPLWPAASPLDVLWSDIRPRVLAQGPHWQFWVDWYDKALNGEPQDWPLLTKIALIDPKDWEKGADHVNALIAGIVRDHHPPKDDTRPAPPRITDIERSHIQLVLAARDPSRQSADFLRDQFEILEQAYRRALGFPNETPEELEPIVVLGRAFGQIASLLRDVTDKEALIAALHLQIKILESQNAALVAAARSSRASVMRDIFVASLGSAFGGATAVWITTGVGFFGGPAVAEGLRPLSELMTPMAQGPLIDLSPSIPRP